MNTTRTLLKYLLDRPGSAYMARDIARAAGFTNPSVAHNAPQLLAAVLKHGAVERLGTDRKYTWRVPNTQAGIEAARAYLAKPDRGMGRPAKGTPFNTDRRERPATPLALDANGMVPMPTEPLVYFMDSDGNLQIAGRESAAIYLVIPKLDAVDLLLFACQCAPVLEAA